MGEEIVVAGRENGASKKQKILLELMFWMVCHARNTQTMNLLRRLRYGREFRRAFDHLNLIHRIPLSILEREYTDNDISFINDGIRHYVEDRGAEIDGSTAWLLVEFVKSVPDARRAEVTWSPPEALRDLADRQPHRLFFDER